MKSVCILKAAWLLLVGLCLAAPPVGAHEIPEDVVVQLQVVPDEDEVRVAIRVPLVAMRDFDFVTRGPGYLDLVRIGTQLQDAARLWLLEDLALIADGVVLAPPRLEGVRVALPSDQSFSKPDGAYHAIVSEPLPEETNLYWEQALFDVALVYRNPAGETADLALTPTFARLGMRTLTRIGHPGEGGEWETMSLPGNPGRISLNPGVFEVFGRFMGLGFEHVLDGMDHLLFVLALVIPVLMIRPLVVVVTAFTLAHSLTLGAALLGLVPTGLWFPPLVELLIAVSIFFMVLENLLAPKAAGRWLIAFGFGLIHGFGFSFALSETLDQAGSHLLVSLAGFNLGIEAGQLLVLLIAVPALRLAGRWLPSEGIALVGSVLIGHTAWHWILERWVVFSAYEFTWPLLDRAFAAGAMRWALLALIAGFLVWLLRTPFERWAAYASGREPRLGKS
jgi:hypothetical protein